MSEQETLLSKYLYQLKRLRRANSKNMGAAPHKPVLLLAIIEEIENGELLSNRIAVTPELVLSFKNIWAKLVQSNYTANFALPFFHMKSEPFWRLVSVNNTEIPVTSSNSIKSLSALRSSLAFAEIDKGLMALLLDPISRTVIKTELLDFYFPDTKSYWSSIKSDYVLQLEKQVLEEDKQSYGHRLEELSQQMKVTDYEEEIYVRSGIFKREIPKIYNYTCAISGLRIEATINVQMVDACHIVPFSVSKDDTVGNGFSLTPTLHRAFDRGLITINDDYIIRVSPAIKELESVFSIKQFEGKQLVLPANNKHHPLLENFEWHRKEKYVL
jgi:putative restriction endonuclease